MNRSIRLLTTLLMISASSLGASPFLPTHRPSKRFSLSYVNSAMICTYQCDGCESTSRALSAPA